MLPPRKSLADFINQEPAKTSVFSMKSVEKIPTKKGKCWSEEEHLAFLAGLQKLGKGNWRGISRYYVPTRTSTQIASHAQKHMQRVSGDTKRVSKFTKIEQQANVAKLDGSRPSGQQHSNPSQAALESFSAPAASGGSSDVDNADEVQERQNLRKRVKHAHQDVCKPTAVRASESEPDLMKLADSLISLRDCGRRLSPSDSSAFTPTPQAGAAWDQDPTPSRCPKEEPFTKI